MAEGSGFGLALIFSAFAFGFRHGFDWDHIAAISDITSSQSSARTGLRLSTLYAAGHAAVVFGVGVVAIVVGGSIPDSVDEAMGRVVGVTLVILGVYVLYALIRYRQDFRMRSRWMLLFSGVRNLWRRVRREEHVHADALVMAGGGSAASHEHAHNHVHDPFVDYGTGTALLVGGLHGVGAETPTQILIFLAAANAGGAVAGVITLLVFLLGLFTANTAVAAASASGFLAAHKRFAVYATVSVITAAASLVLGVSFILGKDAWLPVLFSG